MAKCYKPWPGAAERRAGHGRGSAAGLIEKYPVVAVRPDVQAGIAQVG
jgi:hypothetical protein